MPLRDINDLEKLKKINAALVSRVERSMDQQGNAFSLFQTTISLENRVRTRTEELHSTLRRLEQSNIDLSAAKENAELANLSKTRFLAAASHDVLQPLNAAHLSVSALAEVQTSDEGKKLVRQVERSLETMEDLLRTLLDISKLDAGVVQPDISDVSLEALFSSLRSDFLPVAEMKGLSLKFRPVHAVVRSDRTLLRRILQNILSNALGYTR
ncbi:hybrid sensor histidine kinase/response regulator, partial [Mesorhizobium sp. M7A.F.Ca.CA.001.14.1.1]